MALVATLALTGCQWSANPQAPAEGGQDPIAAAVALAGTTLPTVQLPSSGKLSARSFVQTIAQADENVRSQAIEAAIAREQIGLARGAFDPEFFATTGASYENRQTSVNQVNALLGSNDPFWERSVDGELGVTLRGRSGISADIYLQMSQVENSVQQSSGLPSPEYNLESGVRVSVPLLRNAGRSVTTAPERVAQLDEQIAQATIPLIQSQRAYEGLRTYTRYQRAAARVGTRSQALALTERLARETENQQRTGLVNRAEVTAARARVSEARAALTQARIDLAEQGDSVQTFLTGATTSRLGQRFLPSDPLRPVVRAPLRIGTLQQALARRGEARVQQLELDKTRIEAEVAQNRLRPELNVNLDYARTDLSGSGFELGELLDGDDNFGRWQVGMEYRRVLGDNQAAASSFKAAVLRQQQARLRQGAFRQRLANEVAAIQGILSRAERALSQNQTRLDAQARLVRTEQDRESAGLSTRSDVMTLQLQELLAREARNDAIAQLNQAYYLSAYVGGTLLSAFEVY